MGKFSDLAKQGIRYQPMEEEAPEAPKQEQGNFSRGFEKAMLQVPQTLGGSAALVGDLVGSDGLREYGLDVYQKNADKINAITKDSDSLSNVLEGDASGADWLANSAGYVAGQAVQAVATGGVGGFIGSQLAKRGISQVVARGASSLAAREVAGKVAAQGAKWGAGTALLGNNLAQEAGSIYPEALNEAAKEGRELTGADKARVVGSSVVAAGVDTAMDALMMGRVLKGARKPGESMLRAGAREIPGAMAREGVTEGIQTGIERYGAGQELSTADAIRDYVDSIGVGMVGGGMGGAASVIRANKQVPESGPLTRAANIATEQEVLQLGHNPQPLVSFPDGSVGTRQELHAYLSQFADPDERARKEHELMGRDPETGKPVEPEPQEPPKFADTPEQETQTLADWGAEHDPVPIEQAHALLAAPGTKGQSLMVAPHPGGEGFTVVPSNWLTLDTQAKLGDLQKPVKEGKEKADAVPATTKNGDAGADHVAQPQSTADVATAEPGVSGAVPAVDAAPGAPALNEPEWKTNPYTAFKFATPELAATFMVNRGADPALFEVKEVDGKFAVKRRAEPAVPTAPEGAPDAGDNAVLAAPDGAARGTGDQLADPAGSSEAGADSAVAGQPGELGTADAGAVATGEPDNVRAAGSADADPALIREKIPSKFIEDGHDIDVDARAWKMNTVDAVREAVDLVGESEIHRLVDERSERAARGTLGPELEAAVSLELVARKVVDFYDRKSGSADAAPSDGQQLTPATKLDAARAKHARQDEEVRKAAENIKRRRAKREATAKPKEEAADVSERPQVPDEAPPAPGEEGAQAAQEGASSATPADRERDDGADIPLAFFAKVKVPHEVHVDGENRTETVDVPASTALQSTRDDIAHLEALLNCMGG